MNYNHYMFSFTFTTFVYVHTILTDSFSESCVDLVCVSFVSTTFVHDTDFIDSKMSLVSFLSHYLH